MESNEKIYVAPGKGVSERSEEGRPYRSQPSPMNEDMEQRNMPDPGEEDGGGNPLQEGILGTTDGGWQHPSKRDETFASTKKVVADIGEVSNQNAYPSLWEDDEEEKPLEFKVVGVLPHDEKNPVKQKSSAQKTALWPALLAPAAGLLGRLGIGAAGGAATSGAGAAAGAGGIGSLMRGMLTGKGAKGALMGQGAMAVAEDASGALGMGGENQEAAPDAPIAAPVQDASYYASLHSAKSVGLVLDEIPGDTDDPEEVDQQEQNDGQRDLGLQVGPDVNDVGGTGQAFSEDILNAFDASLPSILESMVSGEVSDDIFELHEQLDAEIPGYLDMADDDQVVEMFVGFFGMDPDEFNYSGDPSDPSLEDNNEPHNPLKEGAAQGKCANCGATIDPSNQACPQCGAKNGLASPSLPQAPLVPQTQQQQQQQGQPAQQKQAETQGPRTDEQKAAVAEFLKDQDRVDEIKTMLLRPWDYADELSIIQKQDNPPVPVSTEDPAGPATMPPAAGPPDGGMGGGPPGMEGMGGPPPGMGGPPPGMGGPPPGGGMGGPPPGLGGPPGEGGPEGGPPEEPPAGPPGAPQQPTASVKGLVWTDIDESPLKVGREYEMRSPSYDIPDIVRITAIKPNSLEFEITSETGLPIRTEVTAEEFREEGISFETFDSGDEPEDESDAVYPESTAGDERNLENVHITAGTNKEAGAKYTPVQQKDFIDEIGTARNADKLDLTHTHYTHNESKDDDFFLWL